MLAHRNKPTDSQRCLSQNQKDLFPSHLLDVPYLRFSCDPTQKNSLYKNVTWIHVPYLCLSMQSYLNMFLVYIFRCNLTQRCFLSIFPYNLTRFFVCMYFYTIRLKDAPYLCVWFDSMLLTYAFLWNLTQRCSFLTSFGEVRIQHISYLCMVAQSNSIFFPYVSLPPSDAMLLFYIFLCWPIQRCSLSLFFMCDLARCC